MNIVKAEVFNADGTLAQVEETHNYITEGYYRNIEQYARALIMGIGVQKYYNTPASYTSYCVGTNNSDAVDTTVGLFDDDTVWYSQTNGTAGGAPKGGQLNVSESHGSMGSSTLVMDFATDRGNGTFQTVHLCNSVDSPMQYSDGLVPAISKTNFYEVSDITDNQIYAMCADSTYIYGLSYTDSDGSIFRFNKTTYAYIDTITLSSPTTAGMYDICTDGTHFYMTTGTSGDTVYKYLLNGTQVSSFSFANSQGITVIGSTLYISAGNTQLYTLDTGLAGPASFVGSTGRNCYLLCTDGTTLYGSDYANGIFTVSPSTATVGELGSTTTTVEGIEYINSTTLLGSYRGFAEIEFTKAFNVVSRARLASAVTKTNTQTMKVTYTFNFS